MLSIAVIKNALFVASFTLITCAAPMLAYEPTDNPSLGQSDWITPTQTDNNSLPVSTGSQANYLGQSNLILPNDTQPSPSRKPEQERNNNLGQSDWMNPGQLGQSNLTCASTLAPKMISEQLPPLLGEVNQTDIVDDSLGLQSSMPSTPNTVPQQGWSGQGSDLPSTPSSQQPSMDEVIGQLMAAPMMMAASAGLLGQTFGSHGPAFGMGFHGFGPGAAVGVVGPRVTGPTAAGYMVGRMINRSARRSLGGMRVGIRFR